MSDYIFPTTDYTFSFSWNANDERQLAQAYVLSGVMRRSGAICIFEARSYQITDYVIEFEFARSKDMSLKDWKEAMDQVREKAKEFEKENEDGDADQARGS